MADINIAERRIPQDGRHRRSTPAARRSTSASRRCRRCTARRSSCGSWTTRRRVLRPATTSASCRAQLRALLESSYTQAVRDDPGHRPDRFGQVDDALRDAQHRQQARRQHHHGRGPGRVPAARASTRCRSTRRPASPSPSALRSILRSDPDVVLVGEIRDHETAQIAIEAALTGHLVLSTLHTNDAPSRRHPAHRDGRRAVPRRLARSTACSPSGSPAGCATSARSRTTPDARGARSRSRCPWTPGEPLPTLYRAVGCAACAKTGYRGRFALHEVMAVTEEIERLTVERASAAEIGEAAREQGMITLRDDGLRKVADGRHLARGDPPRRRLDRRALSGS